MTPVFPPRLSLFSGEGDKDARYAQWRAEVVGLQVDHSETVILQAMRRSVKGVAADVMLQLKDTDTLTSALDKFDKMFGCVQSAEKLYELFYTARQLPGETVVVWACRLERIVADVKGVDSNMSSEASNSMLRSKFWSGLSSSAMRDALRHRVDSGVAYPDLLVAARQVETENAGATPTQSAAVQQQQQLSSGLEATLKGLIQRLENLEKELHKRQPQSDRSFKGNCYKCGQPGHRASRCQQSGNANGRE